MVENTVLINQETEDAVLIERLCAHDLDSLGILFDRYYPQIYRTAVAVTHDSAVAEDIAQDCFLKLNHYADRIDTSLPLAPWLYRVTVNLAYTWISRSKKRRVSLEALVDQLMTPSWHAPDQLAEHAEVQEQVVVVLHYLSGLSLDEIAEVVDCPVGTVKSRLYYARENLRRRLGDSRKISEVAHGYAGLLG